MKESGIKIFITGLTACGKSYQAKLIAKALNIEYICASNILLDYVKQTSGISLCDSNQTHEWLDKSNINTVDLYRDDKKLDNYLLDTANKKSNIIIDSRTVPYLYTGNDAILIYLNPSLDSRTQISYYSKTDKPYSIENLRNKINEKDQNDITRFKNLYEIDIRDTSMFDIVIDNGPLKPEQTHKLLLVSIKNIIQGKSLNKGKLSV